MTERPPRIAVLGLGNVLMGDDALGPTVVRRLDAAYTFSDDVVLQDVGTPGLDLIPFLEGPHSVLLVDTVASSAPAGSVRIYGRDALLAPPPQPRVGPHDPGLRDAMFALELAGRGPAEVVLVGVVPARVAQGVGMSEAVRQALPAAEAEVLRWLAIRGSPGRQRSDPLPPDLWWER